jgi:hypothetical protein
MSVAHSGPLTPINSRDLAIFTLQVEAFTVLSCIVPSVQYCKHNAAYPLSTCMVRPVLKVIENDGKSMANNLLTKKVKGNLYNGNVVLVMKFSSIVQIFDIYSSCEVIRA